ncbi:MAG TPA: hypothetical protein VGW38_17390 [Chloroflexota bacterium]|nr:hypothetical protein [Chloroflexota bacterium]
MIDSVQLQLQYMLRQLREARESLAREIERSLELRAQIEEAQRAGQAREPADA